MVKTTAVIAVLLVTTALASASPLPDGDVDVDEDPGDSPAFNMLGFRLGIGALPLAGTRTQTRSLGLGVEHPIIGKTRAFGEYEWLWLAPSDERAMDSVAIGPERHGTGHRALAGLRRELIAGRQRGNVRMFLDGELGGGFALASDTSRGLLVLPTGFAGLRVGYDIYSNSESSPSSMFELEVLVRAIAVGDGIGLMTGFGVLWGN